MRLTLAFMMNQQKRGQDAEIRDWLMESRLDGFSKLVATIGEDDHEKQAILKKLRDNARPAGLKLMQFLADEQTA